MGYHCYYSGEIEIEKEFSPEVRELLEYIFNPEDFEKDVFFQPPVLPQELQDIYRNDPYVGSDFYINDNGNIETHSGEQSTDAGTMARFWAQVLKLLEQRGYVIEDQTLDWNASDSNDGTGTIYLDTYHGVEDVEDEVYNPGPSWDPKAVISS